MNGPLLLDVRQLETRVQNLTKPLSLRPSSNYHGSTPEAPLSTSPEVNLVLDRIQEMEQRQHWFEALIGGAGGSNADLEAIRDKRIKLEERQMILEQELNQWRRTIKTGSSGITPVHGRTNNGQECGRCVEQLKLEKTKLASLESALAHKESQLKIQENDLKKKQNWVENQTQNVKTQTQKLIDTQRALEIEKMELQNKKAVQAVTAAEAPRASEDCSLAQRELLLLRRTHELEAARSRQRQEEQQLKALRWELQEKQAALQEERLELERRDKSHHQQLRGERNRAQFADDWQVALQQQQAELKAEQTRLEEDRGELIAERHALDSELRTLERERQELVDMQASLRSSTRQIQSPNEETLSGHSPSSISWWCYKVRCCT